MKLVRGCITIVAFVLMQTALSAKSAPAQYVKTSNMQYNNNMFAITDLYLVWSLVAGGRRIQAGD